MGMRKFMLRFALVALASLILSGGALLHTAIDATADGEPYSVSLNSPAKFPVDI